MYFFGFGHDYNIDMPIEIFAQIMSYLSREDMFRSRRVCRSWNETIRTGDFYSRVQRLKLLSYKLDFTHLNFKEIFFEALGEAGSQRLQLMIKNQQIDLEGAKFIANILRQNTPPVLDVTLIGNTFIDPTAVELIANGIGDNPSIQSLQLLSNRMGEGRLLDGTLFHLANGQTKNLKTLTLSMADDDDLSHSTITAFHQLISQIMHRDGTVEILNLSRCQLIGPRIHIIASLISSGKIKSIDLTCDFLDNSGAEAIAAALRSESTILQGLTVQYNEEMTILGLIAITNALRENHTLRTLGFNTMLKGISPSARQEILANLRENYTILSLMSNILSEDTSPELHEILERNRRYLLATNGYIRANQRNDSRKALHFLGNRIALKPDDFEAYHLKGMILYSLHDDHEALAAYDFCLKYINSHPDKFITLNQRTFVAIVLNNHAAVLKSLRRHQEALVGLQNACSYLPPDRSTTILGTKQQRELKNISEIIEKNKAVCIQAIAAETSSVLTIFSLPPIPLSPIDLSWIRSSQNAAPRASTTEQVAPAPPPAAAAGSQTSSEASTITLKPHVNQGSNPRRFFSEQQEKEPEAQPSQSLAPAAPKPPEEKSVDDSPS